MSVPANQASVALPRVSKWIILGVASIGTLSGTLDNSTVAIALPRLSTAFHVDVSVIIWVTVVYMLTSSGLLFVMGWLSDLLGRRLLYTSGFLIFSLGLGLAALSPNILLLTGSRVIEAIGTSMILANGNAVIAGAFPPEERAKAVGIQAIAVGAGLATGPILGGVLLDVLDWRALFYTRLPLSLLGAAAAWWALREYRKGTLEQARPDLVGAVTLFASVAGFLLAVNQLGRVGWSSPLVWVGGATTLMIFPLFVLSEQRALQPVLDLSLFRIRGFSIAVASQAFHFLAWGGVSYMTPFYLLHGLGYSTSLSGLLLSGFQVVRVLGGPLSGMLATKVSARVLCTVGLALIAVGVTLLSRLGSAPEPWAVLVTMMIAGFGSALFEPPNTAMTINSVPVQRMGTASAAVPAGRQIAQSSGIAIAGALLASRQGAREEALVAGGTPVERAGELSTSLAYGDAMLLAAGFALLGTLVSASLRPGGVAGKARHTTRP
ncbi:MAG: MFS transporter [Chloroflexi bacterium]|nr:MFS transporter [Chloroflexota bacterium]